MATGVCLVVDTSVYVDVMSCNVLCLPSNVAVHGESTTTAVPLSSALRCKVVMACTAIVRRENLDLGC